MNAAADKSITELPAIGAAFDGGIFAGITLEGDRCAKLVLLPGDEAGKTHADATAWAAAQGGVLPSRHDMLVLLKNVKSEFRADDWYWTSEEVTGNADYAWVAYFVNGAQFWGHESFDFRCRAVRRVAI